MTHVMINDPTVGYGIFIENMLSHMPVKLAGERKRDAVASLFECLFVVIDFICI